MSLKDSATGYSWLSIVLHWLAAASVITLYVIGDMAGDAGREERRQLIGLHISIGLSVYLILWARIFWRAFNTRPDPVPQTKYLAFLAQWVPVVLLAAIAVMLISGPLAVWSGGRPMSIFGLIELPSPMDEMETLHEFLEEVHEVGANIILAGFILHMAGVLKHLILNRDGTLRRMLVPANRSNAAED